MQHRKDKVQTVNGVKYRYSADWIHKIESKKDWLRYREQQVLMHNKVKPGDTALEIGPGRGICTCYLRSKGVEVTTLDIDADKHPDIRANIVDFQPKQQYDHILAFEVFEHIPYDKCLDVLQTLRAHCRTLFMSLPLNQIRLLRVDFSLPVVKDVSCSLSLPKRKITESHHFWEVNYQQYKKRKIIGDFEALGYRISFFKNYGHLFLILSAVD